MIVIADLVYEKREKGITQQSSQEPKADQEPVIENWLIITPEEVVPIERYKGPPYLICLDWHRCWGILAGTKALLSLTLALPPRQIPYTRRETLHMQAGAAIMYLDIIPVTYYTIEGIKLIPRTIDSPGTPIQLHIDAIAEIHGAAIRLPIHHNKPRSLIIPLTPVEKPITVKARTRKTAIRRLLETIGVKPPTIVGVPLHLKLEIEMYKGVEVDRKTIQLW